MPRAGNSFHSLRELAGITCMPVDVSILPANLMALSL
jgi:hypothetical protein